MCVCVCVCVCVCIAHTNLTVADCSEHQVLCANNQSCVWIYPFSAMARATVMIVLMSQAVVSSKTESVLVGQVGVV